MGESDRRRGRVQSTRVEGEGGGTLGNGGGSRGGGARVIAVRKSALPGLR